MNSTVIVELFSKPDCPLCDDAKAVIAEVRARVPFILKEVNIESDPALFERHRYDIPVVFIDGKKAFKHRLTAREFQARLKR